MSVLNKSISAGCFQHNLNFLIQAVLDSQHHDAHISLQTLHLISVKLITPGLLFWLCVSEIHHLVVLRGTLDEEVSQSR